MHVAAFLILFLPSVAIAKIQVAITVDDLPLTASAPAGQSRLDIVKKMVHSLKKPGVTGVYGFVNGQKVDADPETKNILRLWRESGHLLGNHGYSHASLDLSTVEEFQDEIRKNERLLQELGSSTDWKFFRYPFLRQGNEAKKRTAIRSFLIGRGYRIAEVTIDFSDSTWNDPYARCLEKGKLATIRWLRSSYLENATIQLKQADEILRRVFQREVPHILLLHVGAFNAEMMDALLETYQKEGVEFISLAQAMNDPVYKDDPGVAFDAGAELSYQILKSKNLKLQDLGLKIPSLPPETELARTCL